MSEKESNEFVPARPQPVSDVPIIGPGNRPVDSGALTFTKEEMEAFIAEEPEAAKWFRPWVGGPEFLRGNPRYFLYLKDATPEELAQLPKVSERIKQVEEFRSTSQFEDVAKMAGKPTVMIDENVPDRPYLIIPSIANERRSYVPLDILEPDTLAGTTLHVVPDASLYEFGVLGSNAHMAWMRAAADKVGADYRYAPEKVYNTFPWPEPTPEQRQKIEATAQNILDTRAKFPDKPLAVLYDDRHMPPELREAHEANDRAVMEAYGMDAERAQEADLLDLLRIRHRILTEEGQ